MAIQLEKLQQMVNQNDPRALSILRRSLCDAHKLDLSEKPIIMYLLVLYYYKNAEYTKVQKLSEIWLSRFEFDLVYKVKFENMVAMCYDVSGHKADAAVAYMAVLEGVIKLDDQQLLGRVYNNLARVMADIGDYDKAYDYYHKAMVFFENDPFIQAYANLYHYNTLIERSEFEEAFKIVEKAYKYYESIGDVHRMGFSNECRGDIWNKIGNFDQAFKAYSASIELLSAADRPRDIGLVYLKRAQLLYDNQSYQAAIDDYDMSIALLEKADLPLNIKNGYYERAMCYNALGDQNAAALALKQDWDHGLRVKRLKQIQQSRMIELTFERRREQYKKRAEEQSGQIIHAYNSQIENEAGNLNFAVHRLTGLRELSLALTKAKNFEGAFETAVTHLETLIPCHAFLLCRLNRDYPKSPRPKLGGYSLEVFDSTLGTSGAREPYALSLADDVHAMQAIYSGKSQLVTLEQNQCEAYYAPLINRGMANGLIIIKCSQDAGLSPYDQTLAMAFSSYIASALAVLEQSNALDEQKALHNKLLLDLKEKNRLLSEISYHDTLTGLYNRAGLRYCVDHWLSSMSLPSEVVVAVMDLDHFKIFNDRFGHILGDALLKEIAQLIKSIFSEPDILLTRFGGEEFLLVASAKRFSAVMEKCEALREQVLRMSLGDQLGWQMSISIGVKCDAISSYESLQDLIEGADLQLYRAKLSGRNRVCIA